MSHQQPGTASRRLPRRSSVVATTMLFLAVAACGGDPAEPEPATESESTASSEPTDETTGYGGAEPATGEEINLTSVTLNAPEGWKVRTPTGIQASATAPPRKLLGLMVVTDQEYRSDTSDLDKLARESIDVAGEARDPEIVEPTTVDGVEMYHLAGPIGGSSYVEEFGAGVPGRLVYVNFTFLTILPKADRREFIDSVMASWQWAD